MIGLGFLTRLLQVGLYAAGFILVVVVAAVLVLWAARLSWAMLARSWPAPAAWLRARFTRPPENSRRMR